MASFTELLWISYYISSFIVLQLSSAARILAVFPVPSLSHQIVFRPLIMDLLKHGHEIVVITPDPAFQDGLRPSNLTEIDVHKESYKVMEHYYSLVTKSNVDFITQTSFILDVLVECVKNYPLNNDIQTLIKTKQFDLLLLEAMARPALVFSHIYKVPVIQVSSLGAIFDNYDVIGVPTHPILYPSVLRRRCMKLSIWEKISETYLHFMLNSLLLKYEGIESTELRKNYDSKLPPIGVLANNVDMLILNINPIFEGIRPVSPNVIYMGGIHQKPEKELPRDLKSYLDASKNGVIYLSLGTNVLPSLLPPEKIETFIRVFSELPYDILWKYDRDELPGKTDNVKIGKWFPQADLLRHPNIKLFIMQGGLQSTDEAITAGVPLIGIPVLGDQWFNSEKYEFHKIGIKLDMETLNYNDLKEAINTILGDDSYRCNIVHLRKLIQDEPMKPLERAVWWIEYVLRHGGAKHLRSPAANISWAEYLELEIVLILLSGLLISLIVLVIFLFYVYKVVSRVFRKGNSNLKRKIA